MFRILIACFWTTCLVHAKTCTIGNPKPSDCDSTCTTLKIHQTVLATNTTRFALCFPNLQDLDATSCGIQSINDLLLPNDTMPSLEILDVSKNNLTALNEGDLTGFVKLKKLYLKNNRINRVAWDTFNDLKKLRSVSLTNNQLTNIGSNEFRNAFCCHGITVLSLTNNRLQNVSGLRYFTGLRELYISGNPDLVLNSLPFASLANLIAIALNKVGLTDQTYLSVLNAAGNLQNLSIAGNNFGTLDVAKLPKLENLVHIDLQQINVEGYDALKTQFPALKSLKMTAINWSCDFSYEILEYLKAEHIQWLDKALDTNHCPKVVVMDHTIWIIFAGTCVTTSLLVTGVAFGIYKMKLVTFTAGQPQNDAENNYEEVEVVTAEQRSKRQVIKELQGKNLRQKEVMQTQHGAVYDQLHF